MSDVCGKENDTSDQRSKKQHNPKGSQNNQNHAGDPVNLVTGAFTIDELDVSFPSQRIVIALSRHYDSIQHNQAKQPGSFGWGWTHSFSLHLERCSDTITNEIDYIDDRGTKITFRRDSLYSEFIPPPGSLGMRLSGSPKEGFILRQVDGLTAKFDGQGKITSLMRPGPEKDCLIDFSYNSTGLLSSVSGVKGLGLKFYYLGNSNLIESVVDHVKREWFYYYDKHSNLVQVKDPFGRIREYSYRQKIVKVSHIDEKKDTVEIIERPIKGLFQVFKYRHDKSSTGRFPEVTNQYTSEFRVFQQIDANGGITRFDYNRFTRTTALTDPAGWTMLYSYDQAGNTTRIRKPEGGITEYIYDDNKNLIAEIDENGRKTLYVELLNPNWFDQQMEFGRRALGNRSDYVTVPKSQIIHGYDNNGNRPLKRDPNGNTYHYSNYNHFGKPELVTLPTGEQIKFEYNDRSGLPTRIVRPLFTSSLSPKSWIQSFDYDSWGNLIFQEEWIEGSKNLNSKRRITEFEYDDWGCYLKSRRTWIEHNNRAEIFPNEESFVYDDLGRLLSIKCHRRTTPTSTPEIIETRWEYDVLGRITKEIGPDNVAKCFVYDPNDQVIESFLIDNNPLDALRYTITEKRLLNQLWSYDLIGNLTSFTDPTGIQNKFTYDPRNLCTSILYPTGVNTYFKYDRDGREIERRTSTGYKVTSKYDNAGCLISQFDNLGLEQAWGYDNENRIIYHSQKLEDIISVTHYEYDLLGRVIKVINPDSSYENFLYDERGLINRREKGPNPLSLEIFQYDGLGRLTQIDAGNQTNTYKVFEYKYIDAERCVETIDALGNVTRSYYDSRGNLIQKKDAENHVLKMVYDANDRLVTRSALDLSVNSTLTYDFAGRLINAQERELNYQWDYDSSGRLKCFNQEMGQKRNKVRFFYDHVGRLVRKEINPSWWMAFEYLPDTEFISKVSLPGEQLEISRDSKGQVINELWSNGLETKYSYLANGILSKKETFGKDGEIIYGQHFSFDTSFRRKSEERIVNKKVSNFNYVYDYQNRLKSVYIERNSSKEVLYDYEYDSFGNRLAEYCGNKLQGKWEYDEANRLNSCCIDNQIKHISYDRSGNLSEYEDMQFLYDAAQRLRQVKNTKTNNIIFEFTYSATDIRAVTSQDGMTQWSIFDNLNDVLKLNESEEIINTTYWDVNFDCPLAFSYSSKQLPSPIITDAIGSPICWKHEDEFQSYDPFGVPFCETTLPYGFAGKRFYPVINLYDNKARLYDPLTGRFTQPDPMGCQADGINLYQYARSNPIQYIDALGFKSQKTSYGKISDLLAGGHLVERHVDKSIEFLQNRLANENINAATSFYDLKTAYSVISSTLSANQGTIDQWIDKGVSSKLVVGYTGTKEIGYGIEQGNPDVKTATNAQLVLVLSNSTPGFFIGTGYPIFP